MSLDPGNVHDRVKSDPSFLSWSPLSFLQSLPSRLGYSTKKATSLSDNKHSYDSANDSSGKKHVYPEPEPPDHRKFFNKYNFTDPSILSLAAVPVLLFAAATISPPPTGLSEGLLVDGAKSIGRGLSSFAALTVGSAWKAAKWAFSETVAGETEAGSTVLDLTAQIPTDVAVSLTKRSLGAFELMREGELVNLVWPPASD
jgi:hypothetical protein